MQYVGSIGSCKVTSWWRQHGSKWSRYYGDGCRCTCVRSLFIKSWRDPDVSAHKRRHRYHNNVGVTVTWSHVLTPSLTSSSWVVTVTCSHAGDVIRWEQQVRFRHMPTRQYLCITSDRRVTLTPDSKDPRTVFRLHPVIKVSPAAERAPPRGPPSVGGVSLVCCSFVVDRPCFQHRHIHSLNETKHYVTVMNSVSTQNITRIPQSCLLPDLLNNNSFRLGMQLPVTFTDPWMVEVKKPGNVNVNLVIDGIMRTCSKPDKFIQCRGYSTRTRTNFNNFRYDFPYPFLEFYQLVVWVLILVFFPVSRMVSPTRFYQVPVWVPRTGFQ